MRYKIITSISTHEILARFRARIAAPRGFRACAEGEGEGDQRERKREREGRAVVLHILHSADVRGGHSSFPYTRSVGKKYGGLEANGRTEGRGAPAAGSPVLYFLHGGGCWWLRRHGSVCVPGHLLTREDLVPNL